MLTLSIDDKEVLRRISAGEGLNQDFKLRIDSAKKIALTLVAFANTDGGRLFIGVKDNGHIKGVDPMEEFHMIQAAAELYTSPIIPFESKVHSFAQGKVLEILIQKSSVRPHFAIQEDEQHVYCRQEDEVFKASGVHVRSWREEKSGPSILQFSNKEQAVLDFLNEEGEMSFSEAQKIAKAAPVQVEQFLAKLLNWNIIGIAYDKSGCFYYPITELEQVY